MVQWQDLPPRVRDLIFPYIGDDNWKLHSLVLVNKNWWKNDHGGTR